MSSSTEEQRSVGRPALTEQRRQQIVDAFIRLLAEKGLEATSLDDVASTAGLQRTAIRHYVGNREALIETTLEQLASQYAAQLETATERGLDAVLDKLFEPLFSGDDAEADYAFDALVGQALRSDRLREILHEFYESCEKLIARQIRNANPALSAAVS